METLEKSIKTAIEGVYPFYMPGHKRNKDFFPFDMVDIDVTEIRGTDNLHNPGGLILESMKYAAKVFGAEETTFLVNGSSGGVIAAIMSAVSQGDEILVARNTHKSVYTGMIFSGARPHYILPELTEDGLQGGINPAALREKLEEYPGIAAVFITSPTFEGFVSDIAEISKITREYGVILIVDEAHGAHLPFHSFFPKSAVSLGADIVIQSLHKTLPTLTQTAIIHMNSGLLDFDRLKYMLTITQSTSPSYIFMCVADYAIRRLNEDKSIFEGYVDKLTRFRKRLQTNKHIRLLGMEQAGKSSIFDVDLGRLCFVVDSAATNGRAIEDLLYEKYKIQMEYSGLNYLIGITSPADTQDGYDKLANAVRYISRAMPDEPRAKKSFYAVREPIVSLSPRDAFYASEPRSYPLVDSADLVSYGFVIPYPPGIPILAPGERITEECIASIITGMENGISIVGNGLKDGEILVI